MFAIVLYSLTKINALHIYHRKFTKYLHGTRSLHNILIIFAIKEKVIILTHALYCWLLPATNIPMLLVTGFLIQGHIS